MELRLVGGPHDGKSGPLKLVELNAWPQRIYVRSCAGCEDQVPHSHHMRPADGIQAQEESVYLFDTEDEAGALYIYGPLLDHIVEREREALAA